VDEQRIMNILLHDASPERTLFISAVVLNEPLNLSVLFSHMDSEPLISILTRLQDPNILLLRVLCSQRILSIIVVGEILKFWVSEAFDMEGVRQRSKRIFS